MKLEKFEKIIRELVPETLKITGDFYGWYSDKRPLKVKNVAVAVDYPLDKSVDLNGFDVLIVHHRPFTDVEIPVFVVHTPLDRIDWGCNFQLGKVLNLKDLRFFDEKRLGMFGFTDENFEGILSRVKETLNPLCLRYFFPFKETCKVRVAVFSGCGFLFDDFIENVKRFNVDLVVSGDLTHHAANMLKSFNVGFIDASHYRTEVPGVKYFSSLLKDFFDVEFLDVGEPYICFR